MPFRNFHIWRGRLPHWRADDVTYYVTFRHRRDLADEERGLLLRALLKPDGAKWDLRLAAVLPRETHLICAVLRTPGGAPFELADIVEPAKAKAARQIMKRSGERFPPFWHESFDRIIRDEGELGERWREVLLAAAWTDEQGDLDATVWLAAPPESAEP